MTALPVVAPRDWYAQVPRSTRLHTLVGAIAVGITVIGFGFWSNTALIAGAVVTSGAFVVTGQNKIVQHLEGGVIHEILVREGDHVELGQELMLLDPTGPKAELDRLINRHARALAMEARQRAEITGDAQITIPPELTARHDDPDIISIVGSQQLTFKAWHDNLEADIAALKDGINALRERITAAGVQKKSVERQLELVAEELSSKKALLPRGLIRQSEILAIARTEANLQGEIGRLNGEIGDAKEQIAKTEQQIVGTRTAAIKEAVEQLHQSRAEIADLRERIRSQQGVLQRIRITAPVRGVVVKLRYHTAGGVVEPGKNIMEIIPLQDDLIIEVHVRPQDIDHVKVGQEASIRLAALNRRTTPMLSGTVEYVSADALPDEAQMMQSKDVYIVRVRLNDKLFAFDNKFKPKAGMPAEVYIKTTERTFFEYLVQPIKDSMSRAFRET
jgi:HlyD family type I secretion membrane fusion protein